MTAGVRISSLVGHPALLAAFGGLVPVLALVLLGTDAVAWARWWAAWALLGWLGRPLVLWILGPTSSPPFVLSRILGWMALALLTWVAGMLGVRPLGLGLVTGLTLVLLLGAIPYRPRGRTAWTSWARSETGFGGLLLAATWYRTWNPDLNTLEKFMDFGLLQVCLRAVAYPPVDMWMAGEPVNYYYFGHHAAAFVVRLAGVRPDAGYLLMMGTLGVLTAMAVFGLVRNLVDGEPRTIRQSTFLGASLAAAVIAVGGNFHAVLAGVAAPLAARLRSLPPVRYWFAEATRYIGWRAGQEPIHEFPSYSFAVGDLHAHVLALPLALAQLMLMFGVLGRDRDPRSLLRLATACGVLLGIQSMTNTWDVPIYLAAWISLCGLSLLRAGALRDSLVILATHTAWVALVALLTSLPFHLHFAAMGDGLRLTSQSSPVPDLAVIWGHGFVLTALAAAAVWPSRDRRASPRASSGGRDLPWPDTPLLVLAIGATGLILIPELVYLKDIYLPAAARANTMFKLGYQAYAWWVVVAGWLMVRPGRRIIRDSAKWVLLLQLVYAPFLLDQSIRRLDAEPGRQGLDGLRFLDRDEPGARRGVEYLIEHAHPGDVLLEAAGDSYTQDNRISAMSGVPCPAGWYVHQWLWRGGFTRIGQLSEQVRDMYTTDDDAYRTQLLDAHGVRFIVVGRREWDRYGMVREDRLAAGTRRVVVTPFFRLYERPPREVGHD